MRPLYFSAGTMLCASLVAVWPVAAQNFAAGATIDDALHRQWEGADGQPLPFTTISQVLEFLTTADVVSSSVIEEGVNDTRKVLLEKDGIRLHGAFRDVEIFQATIRLQSGAVRTNFRDDAVFECAAFELARLLNCRFVPPTVRRSIDGREGTLQMWIEGSVTTGKLQEDDDFKPTDSWLWVMQHQMIAIFDNLIYNEDRNEGNIMFMPDGKLILIDHTRAFRNRHELIDPERIRYCERGFFERLRELDRETLGKALGPFVSAVLVDAVEARRIKLVHLIEGLIAEHGESEVLFSFYKVEN